MSLLRLALLIFAWEICTYHPKQGKERAVQTLSLKAGSDLLVCCFHNDSVWLGHSVPDFFPAVKDCSKALVVVAREVSGPLVTCVCWGRGAQEPGERWVFARSAVQNKDVRSLLIPLRPLATVDTQINVTALLAPPSPYLLGSLSPQTELVTKVYVSVLCLHIPNAYVPNRVWFIDSQCVNASLSQLYFWQAFVSLQVAHFGEDFILMTVV